MAPKKAAPKSEHPMAAQAKAMGMGNKMPMMEGGMMNMMSKGMGKGMPPKGMPAKMPPAGMPPKAMGMGKPAETGKANAMTRGNPAAPRYGLKEATPPTKGGKKK